MIYTNVRIYLTLLALQFPSDRYTLLKQAETEEEERGRSGSPIRTVAPTAEYVMICR
jgi:hypothetical protein